MSGATCPVTQCHNSEDFNLHFYIYFNVTYKPKRPYTHLKLYVSIMILNTHNIKEHFKMSEVL